MGRKRRVWVPGLFYHIVCRGNRRDPLFYETEDYINFLYIMESVHERYPFELASYCLMTNHFHLQLRSEQQPVSKVMSHINKKYADYFNKKYELSGHVFEKRFFDDAILSANSMIEVSCYIHLNPVEAGMVKYPEDYLWSSYSFIKDGISYYKFLNQDILLDSVYGEHDDKRKAYCSIVESEVPVTARNLSNEDLIAAAQI